MASTRRIGSEDSATRTALLDAAQALMLDGGHAAVTSRRVAAAAGLKPQLVHYYFRTMDDLFLALVRRGAEHNLERQAQALASPHPLRALWAFSSDPSWTALTMELTALATRRPAIREELGAFAERFRREQADALAGVFQRAGIADDEVPPVVALVLMTAISRVLSLEAALGVDVGHDETRAFVEGWLDRLEPLDR
jgi:AcrR family transcriptional regulator